MAGRGKDIEAAAAYVRLYVNGSAFIKGLDSAGKQLSAFGTKMTDISKRIALAGAAIGAPLAASIRSFVDVGSELQDVSDRTGMAVDSLSRLKFAADQTGSDLGTLEKAIRKAGITSMQEFEAMAETIASIQDPGERAKKAIELMGKSGAMLVPLMANGAEGVRTMAKEAEALGLVVSPDKAARAEALGDAFQVLGKVSTSLSFSIGNALEPAVTSLLAIIAAGVNRLRTWIDNNQEIVVQAALVTVKILAASVAVGAFGAAITASGFALVKAAAVFGAVISPVGILVAAMATLGAYVVSATGNLNTLGNLWGEVGALAGQAWAGIVSAVAGGDLELAGQIAIDGFYAIWESVIQTMGDVWKDFVEYVSSGELGINVFNNLSKYFARAINGLLLIWDRFLETFNNPDLGVFIESADSKMEKRVKQMQDMMGAADEFKKITEFNIAGREKPQESEEDKSARKKLSDRIQRLSDNVAKARAMPAVSTPEITSLSQYSPEDFELDAESGAIRKSLKTSGTFNPFALRSIGAVGPAERTAKATEKTAKNTQKLALLTFR